MAEDTAYTYRLQDVVVTIGTIELSGWGEGDVCTIERANPDWTMKEYATGTVTRSATGSRSGTATIKVAQCAKSNALLEAARLLDQLTGRGMFPFSLMDLNGGQEIVSTKSWIAGPPRQSFAAEAGEREWSLQLARIEYVPLPGQRSLMDALADASLT